MGKYLLGLITGMLFVICVADGEPDRNVQYYWDRPDCISETRTECEVVLTFLYK